MEINLSGHKMALHFVEDFHKTFKESFITCKETAKTIVSFSTLLFSVLAFANGFHPLIDTTFLASAAGLYLCIILIAWYINRPIVISEPFKIEWNELAKYLFYEEDTKVLEVSISAYINAIDENKLFLKGIERWTFAIRLFFAALVSVVAVAYLIKLF